MITKEQFFRRGFGSYFHKGYNLEVITGGEYGNPNKFEGVISCGIFYFWFNGLNRTIYNAKKINHARHLIYKHTGIKFYYEETCERIMNDAYKKKLGLN